MKVLLIRWLDHQSLAGWVDPRDAVSFCSEDTLEVTSVGVEVYKDEDAVVIAQSVAPGAEICGDLLRIMRNCITSMKTIYTEK